MSPIALRHVMKYKNACFSSRLGCPREVKNCLFLDSPGISESKSNPEITWEGYPEIKAYLGD